MLKLIEPTILYEDSDILAVNKPAGLLVHADGRTDESTLADWLVATYPAAKTVGDIFSGDGEHEEREEDDELYTQFARPGIVHRLDKETSGVILLAKTQAGFQCLKRQFAEHSIKKIYHAFVVGVPEESRGVIDRPIGRSMDGSSRSAARSARGILREAETQYIVLKSKDGHAFVQAMPKTGRTHQIRVHLKAIGHPIVGDGMYGSKQNGFGFDRTALHARLIEFENCKGEKVRVEAPYPSDFENARTQIGG